MAGTLHNTMTGTGLIVTERRSGRDRRSISLRTLLRGGLRPRRRGGRRKTDGAALLDWHEPHLALMAMAILLLSLTDALMTLTLLARGAHEVNPVMDYLLVSHPQLFAAAKMSLTGIGVLILVMCARMTVFRVVRVSAILHVFLLVYAALVGYEWWLLRAIS